MGHAAVAGLILCLWLPWLGSKRPVQGCFVGHMEWRGRSLARFWMLGSWHMVLCYVCDAGPVTPVIAGLPAQMRC